MSYRTKAIAAAMLSLASVVPMSFASAADLPVKVKAKPVPEIPFFLVIDDRVSFSYIGRGTDPGVFSIVNGKVNGDTAKSVYSFSHFDVWAYGTNFFAINMFKSDHNDPAAPCINSGLTPTATGGVASAGCAGATEFFGLLRSTYGWNEIFNTKMFSQGPLHNVSFEIGAEGETENNYLAPNKRAFEAGLQFAFDLPYKGYFNVAPLAYKELNHNAFNQCGSLTVAAGAIPGSTCSIDGNTEFKTTWAVEINYYMDLGFLPESINYFAISGRAGFYGPKGDANGLPLNSGAGVASTATKTEINSEPIRLTFDASKAFWGPKYAQFVTTWVSYRYWQNKFGLDHNAELGVCNVIVGGAVTSTNSCTESSYQAGITVKF
jgi:hypothetical protein